MTPALQLLPALDVVGGRAARLPSPSDSADGPRARQPIGESAPGPVGAAQLLTGDPRAMARGFADAGATWIHLVDLDAAFGRGSNAALLADIVAEVGLDVEIAGGIDTPAALDAALATGAARANVAASALSDLDMVADMVARHGDHVSVCLDIDADGNIAPRGHGGMPIGSVWSVIERLEATGCRRYVVTDVSRDGALSGPNINLLERVLACVAGTVIASGGVASLDDVAALRALVPCGLEGAIVGKALLVGAFTLSQALAVAGKSA